MTHAATAITATTFTSPTRSMLESDILAHIEDTDEFVVWNGMHSRKLTWNQMTEEEKAAILQEQVYDYKCRLNGCGMYADWYK